MSKGERAKINRPKEIKVVVKGRPTKKQASLRLKQLSEFLSNNWQGKDEKPLD